jgi:hypothetical protein
VDVDAVDDDSGEQDAGRQEEQGARCAVETDCAVEIGEEATGEKFEDSWTDEELEQRGRRESDPELEEDNSDAPKRESPAGGSLVEEQEQEKEDEVEVELVAEGPGLEKKHGTVGG